jgi:hypothetical protein
MFTIVVKAEDPETYVYHANAVIVNSEMKPERVITLLAVADEITILVVWL